MRVLGAEDWHANGRALVSFAMRLDAATVYIITVSVIGTLLELVMVAYVASLVRESRTKMDGDGAALYLQSRRVQEVLREMRAEFLRR